MAVISIYTHSFDTLRFYAVSIEIVMAAALCLISLNFFGLFYCKNLKSCFFK
jgi:hypothetical protein